MADEHTNAPVPSGHHPVASGHHPVKKVKKKRPLENTSGMGERCVVPASVKKFNWGAFFLTWIWGIGNKAYITLLLFPFALVPVVGWIACFVFWVKIGLKGNEWAWKYKKWDSVAQFHEVQKKWTIAAVSIIILIAVLMVASAGLITAAIFSAVSSMGGGMPTGGEGFQY